MFNLIWLFLRLGATSFGGPAAHTAMMEEEFVHRRQWLSREKFLDLIALTNLIPGPNSTELAIHIGYLRAGWWGFWIAGICFILPAFLIVTAVAYFYVEYSSLPQVQVFLSGAKVVVLAVILLAFERFFRTVFKIKTYQDFGQKPFWNNPKNTLYVFILLISLYLGSIQFNDLSILLNCGLISLFITRRFPKRNNVRELGSLFWVFFKIGSLLFGSGYVLLHFLQTELIEKQQLLTQTQLLDAISVGQFTPGPVFTTASFIGYLLAGGPGAVVATLGIFAPAFLFVALSIPLYKKMNSSPSFRAILDGVIVGSLGLLLMTVWTFGRDLTQAPFMLILFLGSFVLLLKTRIPSALLIVLGGLLAMLV